MKELFSQAVTILFARGFIRVAQLVAFLIFARSLTPDQFGWYGILTTAISLAAMLGSLGLRQASAYEIGRSNITPGDAVVTLVMVWLPLTVAATAVVAFMFMWQIPGLTPLEVSAITFVGVGGTMLVIMLQGVFLGRGEVSAFSTSETLPRLILAGVASAMALLGWITLSSALWLHTITYILTVPLALWLALRNTQTRRLRLDRLPRMIGYGLSFAMNLFLVTLCARISMFVVEFYSGAGEAGRFFAALRVNEIFIEAATAFGLVLFSHSLRTDDMAGTAQRNARISAWIFWSFNFFAILIVAISPHILTLLIGPGYATSAPALQVMAVGLGPAAAAKIIYPTIAGAGRPLFGTTALVLSVAVTGVLATFLVPQLGVTGGAISLVIGQYFLMICYVFSASRLFQLPVRIFLVPTYADLLNIAELIKKKMTNRKFK